MPEPPGLPEASTVDGRLLRLEIWRTTDVGALGRIETKVDDVAKRVNGRPSWAVTAYLTLTTTAVGVLTTLVLSPR